MAGDRALVDLHARAFNAHDLETLASGTRPQARVYRDGLLVGQGPQGCRELIANEYGVHRARAGTVMELDTGEQLIVEWSDAERGGVPVGVLRLRTSGLWIDGIQADHDADIVRKLVASGRNR